MSLALIYPGGDSAAWLEHLRGVDPELDIQIWPEIDYRRRIPMAAVWYHPPGELSRLEGLLCVASLGAGVDHIVADREIPPGAAVTRVVDDGLVREMAEYVVMMVLVHKRRFIEHLERQRARQWVKTADRKQEVHLRVGVMGLGRLGGAAARALAALGIPVHGWSRTPKQTPEYRTFWGSAQLEEFLSVSDVLVCLLPLTPETEDILDRELFEKLPAGAYLINAGRGRHLVEQDLLDALDPGRLSGACLDVFREEPLPPDHPFWPHPAVTVTSHISSITNPANVARQIVENYHRILKGEAPLHTIDRERGY